MSYKTILVHVDASRHAPARIDLAAQLALRHDAHLVGAAMNGLPRVVYEGNSLDLALQVVGAQMDALAEQARGALDGFDARVARAGVASVERRQLNDDAEGGLILQSRYADLLVVGQPDPDEVRFSTIGDLPAYVTLNCARPVLVLPYAGSDFRVPDRILVGWDGGLAATRAIAGALPLLRRARQVTLAVLDVERSWGAHGEQPGADMALYLARQGVPVEVTVRSHQPDAGATLLTMAADFQADLLVMGAYGHSRFREVVLGGTTDTVLDTMTLPVLLAH